MNRKDSIITFKVDGALHDVIKDIPNRSEFIRSAIFQALGCICPLCNGSGILNKSQKQHWDNFSADHPMRQCDECNENIIICESSH